MAETVALKKGMNIMQSSNVLLAIMVILILSVMILPLPTFLMDVLLVMNITGALVILFVSLYISRPLEFSVFPGLLLIITLFRLSLNVATTRLILSRGYAGELIASFGGFVVQGNYIVGAVIFLILIIINFVVITKGATRIAEVSARFTLDAMPGKQMAIDADLNAGLIDDTEARQRRDNIAREADFYGAMDGASKFVRGDAIAGLLITSVNIIGGLAIGVLQRHLPIGEAASVYTLLTIGDGLVAQIPALVISTASGIIISRAASGSSFGLEIASQVVSQPKAIFVTAGVLGLLSIIPGLPFFPFILMAGIIWFIGFTSQKNQKIMAGKSQEEAQKDKETKIEEKIENYLHPDPFEIEIGYGLIPLVDSTHNGNLLDRITTIRKSLAIELGIVVPPIRIRDNIQLNSNEYVFKIYGIIVAHGNVQSEQYLVINPDDRVKLSGTTTTEPTFNLPAIWISKKEKEKAEVAGYTVVEPPAIIATHLMETLKANAHKLIDRQETKRMLDHLKETRPAIVESLVPEVVSLGTINQVLKNLLREKIPVRNLVLILETISDYAAFSKDADVLTEYVRASLAETITDYFKQDNNIINIATLEPRVEDKIMETVKNGNGRSKNLGFSPVQVNELLESVQDKVEKMVSQGTPPVLLTSPQIRRVVRNFIEPILPNLAVLSYSELTPETNLKSVGAVKYPHEA
jgi:flagellar biosynthesis protein FlhA